MIRKSKITSLAELQKRKKQVRMESELAKREFAHSVGTTRENTGQFLLKKVAVPVGGGILGLFVLSSLFSSGNSNKQPVIKETKVIHEWPDGTPYVPGKSRNSRFGFKKFTALMGALRVLMPILQAVIGAVNTHKAKEAAETAKRASVQR